MVPAVHKVNTKPVMERHHMITISGLTDAMMKPKKERTKDRMIRKTVAIQESLWERIADYQTKEAIVSEVEALRRVVVAGLKVLERDD